MTEKLPDYELFRREKMRMNMEALDKRVYAERPGFKSYARDIVYGSANRPNKQNNNTKDDAPSDPEFDPHELDETPDADDDENGDACKDKGANSSKNTGPTSCGKRTRSRTWDASTTKTTRRTRSRAEAEGEEAAQATQAPANISSPEGRNSDTIAAQSDAIVAAQGQAGSSSGGSGQITKEKGKRRPYMGHALQDYTRRNGKMKIEFTEGKPRPLNPLHAAKLSSECGVAVRKKLPIPLHWKEFKTEELKHAIPSAIKGVAGKFDIDRNDEVAKDVCTKILQKSIRQHRYRLKRDYFNGFTVEQALTNKPTKLSVEKWTRLVYYFADEKHQELCEKNQKNQEGVKHKQKTGSRCYVAHRNFLKEKYNNEEPGAIDFFKKSHTQKKTGTMSADALEAYTKMDEMRRECQSEGAEPKSDVEIVQHVMKEKSTYLSTLGYSTTSKTSTGSSTSTARILELEARLEQQEKEARESNEKHEQELTSRFEAQQLEIEKLKRKQHEELDTIKKSQKDQLEANDVPLLQSLPVLSFCLSLHVFGSVSFCYEYFVMFALSFSLY